MGTPSGTTLLTGERFALPSPSAASRFTPGVGFALVAVIGLFFPQFAPGFPTSITTQILYFCVLALSVDLLAGYVGLYSFGQAAFYGIGAYTASLVGLHLTADLLIRLVLAIACAAVAGIVVGFLAIRRTGVYFIMLTLALGQLVYGLAMGLRDVTGGSDGLSGMPPPVLNLGFAEFQLWDQRSRYYLCLVAALGSFLLLRAVVQSPFGLVLQGIRENENRQISLGYRVQGYKLAAFVLSAGLAGLAGALGSFDTGIVTTSNLNWSLSSFAVIMVLMGGIGTLYGAILGAVVVLLAQNALGSVTLHWQFVLGIAFLAVTLVSRNGLVGIGGQGWNLVRSWQRARHGRRTRNGAAHTDGGRS